MKDKRLVQAFRTARLSVARVEPWVFGVGLVIGCPLAERHHREGARNYMHVGHRRGMVCTASAAADLPRRNQVALFLHEFGHLIGGPEQWQANMAIFDRLGIPILYDARMVQTLE